jgi:hypothetical protein
MNNSTIRHIAQSRALPCTDSHLAGFRSGVSACRWLAAVVALFLFAVVSARADDTLHISSSYKAAGKNADGSNYTGTVSVKSISDTTYTIEWKIDGGVIKGFGMRRNNVLSATYMLEGQPGLIIYQVQKDGTLLGTWAIKGQSGNGSEILTPQN